MSVPSFSDLGQSARNVFSTGYHYGKSLIKLVAKKTGDNFDVNTDLALDCDAKKLSGTAGAVYKTQDYGSFLQKWTMDGTLVVGYILRNGTPISDVGLRSEISYNPGTDDKAIKIGANCSKENFSALCSISSDMNSNVNILGSIVTAIKGLLIGYQAGYSSETNKMTKNDLGMAFNFYDVDFHLRCNTIPHEFGLSLLYKVNEDWETAVNGLVSKNGGIQDSTVGAAAKYNIDERSTFRCKFNTDLQLGMSLQQKLDDTVTVSLSCNVDCANVTRGGHKVGFALEIEG
ncbi:Voltage-dependent anion-selective channel [Dufourea novaeangliae]|uniref:Voltage-dependent anion-selective channel n=1 Tax=Dufourea novaeangliae TaxID=178035 RepID=A0A154P026_DUFNO|nr:Voltage-dependent anion-selective channel [Dufourea novaeangliae]